MGEPTQNEIELWTMLDDIDTALDAFKPELTPFTQYIMKILHKRHEILVSDGFDLEYPEEHRQ